VGFRDPIRTNMNMDPILAIANHYLSTFASAFPPPRISHPHDTQREQTKMPAPINPLDILAVQNVLARYCEALDTKDFSLFDKVFVPDVAADYPFNNDMKSVDAVRDAITNR